MTPFFTSKISRSVFVQENTSTLVMYTWPRQQQQRRALQRAKAKHQWKTKKKADAAFRASVEEEAGSPAQMTCGTNACSPFFVVFFESAIVLLLGRLHTGDANTVEQGERL